MLRCYELGLSLEDLNVLEYGSIQDMLIERGNDSEKYQQLASQDDFDKF